MVSFLERPTRADSLQSSCSARFLNEEFWLSIRPVCFFQLIVSVREDTRIPLFTEEGSLGGLQLERLQYSKVIGFEYEVAGVA